MTKHIGYYCQHTPGDGTTLDKLSDSYGSKLEGVSILEKSRILCQCAERVFDRLLLTDSSGIYREESLEHIQKLIGELDTGDVLGLMQVLIQELKN